MRLIFPCAVQLSCATFLLFITTAHAASPVFVPGACPKAAQAVTLKLQCGTVAVPENRSEASSRTIQLAVFILGGDAAGAAADPIMFLTGGPGDGAFGILKVVARFPETRALLAHRPFVTFDPRGIGYSTPPLNCGNLVDTACVKKLAAEGTDFRGYTLRENVADVDAVRQALGAPAIDLYGISFGSRWALDVVRAYPGTVRAMVLDGPQPPQTREDSRSAKLSASAIIGLIQACEHDTACGAAFPDLANRYFAGVAALDANPIVVGGQTITGSQIASALFTAQYNPRFLGDIPLAMNQTANGQLPALLASGTNLIPINDSASLAVAELVACGESFRTEDVPGLTRLAKTSGPAALVASGYLASYAECALWPHATSPQAQLRPVRSAIPAFIYIGEYDPTTTFAYAETAAQTLPNAQIVLFPGRSHTQIFYSACGLAIASALFDQLDPGRVDTRCAAYLPQPTWVTH